LPALAGESFRHAGAYWTRADTATGAIGSDARDNAGAVAAKP
jgi:hypothetical protein